MEVYFKFYKNQEDSFPLPTDGFDTRGGLNILMLGMDAYEVEEATRLLYQVERALDFNLSWLNFWDSKVYNQMIDISFYIHFLEQCIIKIEAQNSFHQTIDYVYVYKKFIADELLPTLQSFQAYLKNQVKKEAKFFKMDTA